jgi:hypothetical protein
MTRGLHGRRGGGGSRGPPADPDILPDPDAMIVAPATANTINKWAAGISDTLPLALPG